MSNALTFAPRVLHLVDDAGLIRQQLAGAAFDRAAWGVLAPDGLAPLRADVSTDEITPLPSMVHFDEALGRHAHTGFVAGGERPIARDALAQSGIQVLVAGQRYGKGSSREHSVVAEKAAGIRLVVAESFERIYRQNADNVGLFTSTNLALVARIERGEAILLDELLEGRDALASAIVRAGGLLAYGRAHLRGLAWGLVRGLASLAPRTLFQKIIDRHTVATPQTPALLKPGEGGFVRADWRFIHEYYTGMAAWLLDRAEGGPVTLQDPATILAFEDHLSYVHRSPVHVQQGLVSSVVGLSRAHRAWVQRHQVRHHGYLQALEAGDAGNTGSEGISHAIMAERYALPGQVVVGTDSHTPHSGALGCVAFGVGTTDMANAFVTGAVRITMPASIRVVLHGRMPDGVAAKDVVLHLLALPAIRQGAGVGKVFEFVGDAVRSMNVDERATLTNMVAELGGFTGIVAPDDVTVKYLKERRGVDFELAPWMTSDAGAYYDQSIEVNVASLTPMVARPGDPGRGVALCALEARVPIDIAYGGSCTAGKREDFDRYHEVLAWGAARGLRVPPHVKLYLQFGTDDVRRHCESLGYLATFHAVGAELLHAACGACANCGPGASSDASQVTVSAINRNFAGRSGPGQVWLASPATVAASALAGRLLSFADLKASAV